MMQLLFLYKKKKKNFIWVIGVVLFLLISERLDIIQNMEEN